MRAAHAVVIWTKGSPSLGRRQICPEIAVPLTSTNVEGLAQITLRLTLPRATPELLRARARREGRNLKGLIAKILTRGAT